MKAICVVVLMVNRASFYCIFSKTIFRNPFWFQAIAAVSGRRTVFINNVKYFEGDIIEEGRRSFSISNLLRATDLNTACQAKAPGAYCSDDCGTLYVRHLMTSIWLPLYSISWILQVCGNEARATDSFRCSAFTDRDTPYCWNDRCQAEQDVSNPNCGSSFRCTGEGAYPGKASCVVICLSSIYFFGTLHFRS